MSMTFTHTLTGELTLIIPPATTYYVEMQTVPTSVTLSLKLLSAGATAVVQSAFESRNHFLNTAQSDADLLYSYPTIGGTVTPSITADVPYCSIPSPTVIRIQNTSSVGKNIRVSLRAIR